MRALAGRGVCPLSAFAQAITEASQTLLPLFLVHTATLRLCGTHQARSSGLALLFPLRYATSSLFYSPQSTFFWSSAALLSEYPSANAQNATDE